MIIYQANKDLFSGKQSCAEKRDNLLIFFEWEELIDSVV